MSEARARTRALVLSTGKPLFDAARAAFAEGTEYLDLSVCPAGEQPSAAALTVPSFDHDRETLGIVDRIMARTPFRYVLATSESNVAFAAFLRSRYGLPGLDFESALGVTNKWRMKASVGRALPAPRSWLSGDFAVAPLGSLPREVVVKPLSGSSGKGVRRLPAWEARRLAVEADGLFLVEEAVEVDAELHVDGVVRGGVLRAALASAYDRPVLSAAGTTRASLHLPPGDPRQGPALRAAGRCVAALGVADCVFHLELFREAGGGLLFNEIALRPAGGGVAESLLLFHGVDLWEEFVRIQLGRPPGEGARGTAGPGGPGPGPGRGAAGAGGAGPGGFCGVIGVAAPVPGDGRRVPGDRELLAVPGVVRVSAGSSRAAARARLGSSCAFSRLAFFSCPDEAAAHAAVAGVDRLTAAR